MSTYINCTNAEFQVPSVRKVRLLLLRWDYYATLGLHRGASEDQIRRAYRKLALKYRPDKNAGNEDAANRFAAIGHAYGALSVAGKRHFYGEEGVKQHTFSTFFGSKFGDFGAGREAEALKGDPINVDLEVSLKDLYLGQLLRLGRDKNVIKPAKGVRKCTCKQHMVTRQVGPGMFQQLAKEVCEECPNVKITRDCESLECRDNRIFTRDGNNLRMTHRIDLVDTLTGFRHNFTHIYGRMVELASSAIIFPGDIEIKSSEGMAVYEGNENFGYFIITYQVDFPIPLMMNKKFK
ncbi:predicted protein [Micromonas commoda]|uniref:J domain-containing protein n=1 Tax=Micromonas commoda (strain RCC299 / NOUM17 / CCMP2709) TaxID=296587 RepID=C1FE56_MICCC|nr:predicted protein [Micromonas commoda]ACO68904.1 predicted protein [Micromonas commoda]|eukprot:XP_002507646.1 predicted protein [Micromonas commoda]